MPQMDLETKELMQEVKAQLEEGNKVKAAVAQIEETLRGLPATIDAKLKAVRRAQWDGNGSYRGVFNSEDDARCFGLLVLRNVGHDTRAAEILSGEMKAVLERAHGSNPTDAGGALVPVEYSTRIEILIENFGVYAANVFTMPMSTDSMTFSRRTKGLKAYKVGQNLPATASEMGFEQINLNADELAVFTTYPRSLGDDAAASIGELIALEIAQAFAESLDHGGFVGDGTPDDLDMTGIVTRLIAINTVTPGANGGLILGSGNAGDGWDGLVEDDFLKVIGQMPAYRGLSAAWYCSNAFFWTVMAPIQTAKGGVTIRELAGGPVLQFLGHPVRITQSMPKASGDSQVPALFGDLRLSSTRGRRQELTVEESRHVKFQERQIAVLGTQRHAIANHSLGTADAAGPVVGLLTQPAA